MKPIKITLLILCLATLLSSCTKKQDVDTFGGNSTVNDSYELQIQHYVELLKTLQDELLEEKEENFILKCTYDAEIEALEQEITYLKQQTSHATDQGGNSANRNDVYPEQFEETLAEALFKYEVIDQKLTLCRFIGDKSSVNIPRSVDGVKLAKIGDEAFKNSDVSSVIISHGIEEIGWFAFSGCRLLEKIEIPASVTLVGYGAFDYCSSSLTIICEKGSYIEAYAKSWGINIEYK